jgi:hypothetical protein
MSTVDIGDIPGLGPVSTAPAKAPAAPAAPPAAPAAPAAPPAAPAAPAAPPAPPVAPPAPPTAPVTPPAVPPTAPTAPTAPIPPTAPTAPTAPVAPVAPGAEPEEGCEETATGCPATAPDGRRCVKEVGHEKKHYYGKVKKADEATTEEVAADAPKATPLAPGAGMTNMVGIIEEYELNLRAQLESIKPFKILMEEHQKIAAKLSAVFAPIGK